MHVGSNPTGADERDSALDANQVLQHALSRAPTLVSRARSGQLGCYCVRNVQMFLTDIANLPAIRDIRDEFVNTEQPPASTTVQVAALFHPDVLFEIDAIAYAPSVTDQSAQ